MNMKPIGESKKYENKFSFGINLNITIEEYNKILHKYKKYISSVYFSLPLGDEFHTRQAVINEYHDINARKRLFDILEIFKKNNIKLEVVINQYKIRTEKLLEAINFLEKEIAVDSICTLDEYANIIRKKFPSQYLVSSFNNYNRNYRELKRENIYNEIVIGRKFLRDIDYIKYIKSLGMDVKLLLNNGCSFNCGTCRQGEKNCKTTFDDNLTRYNIEELYSLQSFWPYELGKLEQKLNLNCIKEFKISNRPCTYKYLDDCLFSYLFNEEKQEEEFLEEDINNYRLWGRLAHFNKYFKEMKVNEIRKIKEQIWKLI